MAVRNFWIDLSVDGRKTPLAGGPRAKDGELDGTLYIRHNGAIIPAISINGHVESDGTLELVATLRGEALRAGLSDHCSAVRVIAQR